MSESKTHFLLKRVCLKTLEYIASLPEQSIIALLVTLNEIFRLNDIENPFISWRYFFLDALTIHKPKADQFASIPTTWEGVAVSIERLFPHGLEEWAVLVAVFAWFKNQHERRRDSIIRAWQVILDSHGKSGDGGRIAALELLNNSSKARRYPWSLWAYEAEDLSQIDVACKALPGALLSGINLKNALLRGALFDYCCLGSANLEGAMLSGATLKGADFRGANLKGADLEDANLEGADLEDANLERANLVYANLERANFFGANLERANLEDANLKGAHFARANLKRAIFRGANLKGADFGMRNLTKVDIGIENLEGAEFTGAICNTVELGAEGNFLYPTNFPKGFDPVAHGMIVNNKE